MVRGSRASRTPGTTRVRRDKAGDRSNRVDPPDGPAVRERLAVDLDRARVPKSRAGFASLRHIVQMAPAIIKLDMSLVRGVDQDPARRALVSGIASFADEVGA